jgi:parvulin-like peptidyl-prolyl isomerase
LGAIYRDTNRVDLAINQFKEVVSRKPDDPEAHNQLGMLYGASQHYPEAIREFEKAVQLDPKESGYRSNLALAKSRTNAAILRFRIIETQSKAAADVIYKKLQKGENWDALAKDYSVHPSARSGQPVLELASSDVNPAIAKALSHLKSGEFSAPILSGKSYFLVKRE